MDQNGRFPPTSLGLVDKCSTILSSKALGIIPSLSIGTGTITFDSKTYYDIISLTIVP